MRILVVDDSDIALAMLRKSLEAAGHRVDCASSGEEALAWVGKGLHRLVISDWDMPGMDGLTLCRSVRAMQTDYIYFILLTSHNSADDLVTGLSAGADDFISKPFNPAELLVRVRGAERIVSLEMRGVGIFAMAKLAESRDEETGKHLERVRSYAELLARYLKEIPKFRGIVDEQFVRLIYDTSPLHDIGKVGIPDRILLKSGHLTDDEYRVMRTHTSIGRDTLDAALEKYPEAQFLQFARDIAACHHEHFDGSGYPEGLAGEQIPLCARVVSVADVYDALTSNRVYRKAMPHEDARDFIVQRSGTQFDPDVVYAFLKLESKFQTVCRELADPELEAPGSAGSTAVGPGAHAMTFLAPDTFTSTDRYENPACST
jgi:putative two-component system response regulator